MNPENLNDALHIAAALSFFDVLHDRGSAINFILGQRSIVGYDGRAGDEGLRQ